MSKATAVAARLTSLLLGLGPARTRNVRSELNLEVPMEDGVVLYADRWYPRDAPGAPIILMRSPYGRSGPLSVLGHLFAERGYQAVIQSCRGTFGSGGTFVPFRDEVPDGRATLAWVQEQDWFTGTVGTWGASYLGLTQWAMAADNPPFVKAMAMSVTDSDCGGSVIMPGGAFALESSLLWACQNKLPPPAGFVAGRKRAEEFNKRLPTAYAQLPLAAGDVALVDQTVDFYQEWLEHNDPQDPWWDAGDFSPAVPGTEARVSMVAGWYDLFMPFQLEDFTRLQAAGRQPRMVVGPWAHGDGGLFKSSLRDAIDLFAETLLERPGKPRRALRLQLVGDKRWVEFDQWPPPGRSVDWFLHPAGRLAQDAPPESPPDAYRYDPADPTPGVGGPSLSESNRGPRDNRPREARSDVLTYTSEIFKADTSYIGPIQVCVHFESSLRNTDIHVTLCDVDPKGVSLNLASGILRRRDVETAADTPLGVEMWPLGCTIKAGHCLRVQVASGAHPTYARNLGTGEPLTTGTAMMVAEQRVFHDPGHPSRVTLNEVAL